MPDGNIGETVSPLTTSAEAVLLRQAVRFIFGNFFVLLAGVAAGVLLGFTAQRFLPVTYESDGSFIVDEPPFLQNVVQNGALDGSTESGLVQSLIMGIPNLKMRDEIAAQLGTAGTNLCFESLSGRPLSLRGPGPAANIRISSVHDSRTGTISVTSQSATFAAAVANTLLDELLNYNTAQGRLDALRLDMTFAAARAGSIETQLVTLQLTLDLQEQEVAQLDEVVKKGAPLAAFPSFATDITLNNLKTQRLLAQAEYTALAASSPGGMDLESKKAGLDRIGEEIEQQAESLATGLRAQLAETKTQEQNLRNELNTAQEKVQSLNREKAAWVQSYGDIGAMKRLIATEPGQRAQAGSAIVVVERAVPAEQRKSPKLWVSLAIGIFLGGLAGLAVATVATLMDDRITSAQTLSALTGLPCVATVPRPGLFARKPKNPALAPADPTGFDPLRSGLLLTPAKTTIQILAFTPARRRHGASPLVAQLAVMLARAGRRTLVVDLHFRVPRQGRLLNIKPKHNLADWMASTDEIEQYISPSELPELGLLACAAGKNATGELAGRRPLAVILPRLQDKWDFILIDSPAILANWDLALTLPAGSAVVITANLRRTRASDVVQTARRAHSLHWQVAGVALLRCAKSKIA